MPKTIFYAWQSDRPKALTREFIRDAIDKAIARLNNVAEVEDADDIDQWEVDHDTKGVPGTPPLAETILRKIENCTIFVADVTCVSDYANDAGKAKKTVNSNVLIELGYARGKRGTDVVITVQNTQYGKPADLPFDLQHLRHPIQFKVSEGMPSAKRQREKENLIETLEKAFHNILDIVVASEAKAKAARDMKRKDELTHVHRSLVERLKAKNFYGVGGREATLAVSMSPLVSLVQKLDLIKLHQACNASLNTIATDKTHIQNIEAIPRNGKFIKVAYNSQKYQYGVKQTDVESVVELTETADICAACRLLVFDNEDRKTNLFGDCEGKMMHAGGGFARFLMQNAGAKPPFIVTISLLGVHDVHLIPSETDISNPRALLEDEIHPEPCNVDIPCDPSDCTNVVNQFIGGLKQAMDGIWREAGQTRGDPHYRNIYAMAGMMGATKNSI